MKDIMEIGKAWDDYLKAVNEHAHSDIIGRLWKRVVVLLNECRESYRINEDNSNE